MVSRQCFAVPFMSKSASSSNFLMYSFMGNYTFTLSLYSIVIPRYSSTFPLVIMSGLFFPNLSLSFCSICSTCNVIVHWLPLIFFICHTSIIFVDLETHSWNVLDKRLQNSNAACKVPYNAFLNCIISFYFAIITYLVLVCLQFEFND